MFLPNLVSCEDSMHKCTQGSSCDNDPVKKVCVTESLHCIALSERWDLCKLCSRFEAYT